MQEAVVRLWQLRDTPPDDFSAWLVHAVVHRSLHLRRTDERRRRHESHACTARADRCGDDPAEIYEAADLMESIEAAIRALPAPFAAVLAERYASGDQPSVIARRLGIPVGTVRSRLSRARKLLVERLGAIDFDFACRVCRDQVKGAVSPERRRNDAREDVA